MDSISHGKAITSLFTLALKSRLLGGFKIAEFAAPASPVQSGETRTFAMTITIDDTAKGFPPETLARTLYHEGAHMQLYVDRAVPEWATSRYLWPFQRYLDVARQNVNYQPLLAEVKAVVRSRTEGGPKLNSGLEATTIVEHIIEDKYADDAVLTSRLGGASSGLTTSEKHVAYLRRISRWLSTYLEEIGVNGVPPDELASMSGKLLSLWLEIDDRAPGPPSSPELVGQHPTPKTGILPPPPPG